MSQPAPAAGPFSVRPSPVHGRGVFARDPVPAGVVLFRDPVVVLGDSDLAAVRGTALGRYWWHWGDGAAVVLGLGSLVNHAPDPNVACRQDRDGGVMIFESLRPLAAGDELLLDYRSNRPAPRP
jgi:hypothetical protein